jgi:serine/threonine-protein kinase
MEMVYVPAGEFQMGSTEEHVKYAMRICTESFGDCPQEWFDDEQPAHRVTLDAFWIDRTEVTVAHFRRFAKAAHYETTAERQGWGMTWADTKEAWQQVSGADWQHPQGPGSDTQNEHPAVQLSWADARAYCEWAGARLPTEAEWEYAARGSGERVYPWGDSFDGKRLNYCDTYCPMRSRDSEHTDGYAHTAPVGRYLEGESWCGAQDLAGNVWEWVADWHGEYPRGRQVNPTGPSSGEARVARGGSWGSYPGSVRGANRNEEDPNATRYNLGFRCARDSD